jgi:hypothetical protein
MINESEHRKKASIESERLEKTKYATTSTISGSGDQGADPNKLVVVTDQLSATTLPTWERFFTLRTAGFGEVLRGVAWTPGTGSH